MFWSDYKKKGSDIYIVAALPARLAVRWPTHIAQMEDWKDQGIYHLIKITIFVILTSEMYLI